MINMRIPSTFGVSTSSLRVEFITENNNFHYNGFVIGKSGLNHTVSLLIAFGREREKFIGRQISTRPTDSIQHRRTSMLWDINSNIIIPYRFHLNRFDWKFNAKSALGLKFEYFEWQKHQFTTLFVVQIIEFRTGCLCAYVCSLLATALLKMANLSI